jgi:transcriptional regulator with XRE-family HTH domain
MENVMYKQLPNLLRKYRKVRGLRQEDAARILGLSRNRVSRWEKGMCIPTLANAIRLAILYRVMVDALFDDLVRALRKEVHDREERVPEETATLTEHAL